jgi:hypothetical protein
LLEKHHYLGTANAVGEQAYYVAVTPNGGWLAILVFCAAARHLKAREEWVGWNNEQRRRRLALAVNNSRFLMLPNVKVPNLASRILRLATDRISADWQSNYGHPVLLVETFVDPEQFRGTVYTAAGWVELGQTKGYGRTQGDYYVKHNRPKKLFAKELRKNARRNLQAERLKPELEAVEDKVPVICTQSVKQIRSLVEHFRKVPDFRRWIKRYPVWSLLAIVALAHLCGAPKGQKELSGYAKRMSEAQRRAVGIRRNRDGKYAAPSQPTFCRMLNQVNPEKVQEVILAFQKQIRGAPPKEDLAVFDGKEQRHSRGRQLVTAVTVPSQFYLGSLPVEEKRNEIPAMRQMARTLDLEGRKVSADALHTQTETAQTLLYEAGSDYLFTVKNNQKGLRKRIAGIFSETPEAFFPSSNDKNISSDGGAEQEKTGNQGDQNAACLS